MVIVYKLAPTDEIFFESDLSVAFDDPAQGFVERKEISTLGDSVVDHYEIMFRDVDLWHGKMHLTEDIELNARIDLPVIRMIFSVTANVLYENYSGENDVFSFSPNQHNLVFSPPVHGKLSHKASETAEQFEITLRPGFVLKYLPQAELFDGFRKAIDNNQFALLNPYNLPITAEMKVLLKDILNCQKNASLKRIYIEARIIELLMLQLEQYEQIAGNVICNTLRKTDIHKMHQVRTIIDNSWKEPCSLIDLAQQVTTNEYNLKKSFKEVFGTTIFGYLNEVKMNEAKRLLLAGEKNIAEVADIVGYKNPNHFTTAFKKHFGYVPSELK